MIIVKGHARHPVFVQTQETRYAVNLPLAPRGIALGDDPPKGVLDLGRHRDEARATAGLGILDVIMHVGRALELAGDADLTAREIEVRESQPAILGDAQASLEENQEVEK